MKIFRSNYSHEPLPGKPHTGCLLKVEFGAWRIGYADLHPWPEYGEEELETQLEMFLGGFPTTLIVKSLYFAAEDAAARRAQRNCLTGLNLPRTHYLAKEASQIDEGLALGFTHFKVKTADLQNVVLPPRAKLRVDLAGKFNFAQFHLWWEDLSDDVRSSIDMIEDPWSGPGEDFENPTLLFSDWKENPAWQGKVVKPARHTGELDPRWRRIVFTHSLDHPFAHACAIWEAARFYKRFPRMFEPCGFFRSENSSFFSDWKSFGPRLSPSKGSGFGFDDQLNSLRWERVI